MSTALARSAPVPQTALGIAPEGEVDRYLVAVQAKLLPRGIQYHDYQLNTARQTILTFLPHYPRLTRLLSSPPADSSSKAAKERYANEVREILQYLGVPIFWDMGVGKTAESVLLCEALHEFFPKLFADAMPNPQPCLIVCKSANVAEWEAEIRKWSLRDLSRDLLTVPTDDATAQAMLTMARFIRPFYVITTYDGLRCRANLFQEVFWGIVVNDECHYVKNKETQRCKALITTPNKVRISLGGTPITNKPSDLWAILAHLFGYPVIAQREDGSTYAILRSSLWGDYEGFVDDYCEVQDGRILGGQNLTAGTCTSCDRSRCRYCNTRYYPPSMKRKTCGQCQKPIPEPCQRCDQPLHNKMKAMGASRICSHEVLNLEPYQMITVYHGMTDPQWRIYEQLKVGYLKYLKEQDFSVLQISNVLAQWTYFLQTTTDMRQIAASMARRAGEYKGGASIMDYVRLTNIASALRDDEYSGKLNKLREMLEDEIDLDGYTDGKPNKVIIFCRFDAATNALAQDLRAWRPVVVNGDSNQRGATAERVHRFNHDDECRILVGTSAAFEGMNLQVANRVVLYGHVDWSPMRMMQAIKRAHRQGQDRTVWVYLLLARDTIEQHLQERWFNKQDDFDAALDGKSISRSAVWSLGHRELASMV